MSQEIPFEPFLFQSPHHQTILSSFLNFIFEPTSKTEYVHLADGDQLAMEISEPEGWKTTDLSVVLVHGLCGSHQSPNPARMAIRLSALGIRSVRFNMRGCGSGRGLAKHIYHSGRSEDLFEVIKHLKFKHPDSPIVLIGFSLGGNIVLKMVGELSDVGHRYLQGVIAVSPPVDLYSSVQMIGQPDNAFYERYFYKLLRADAYYRHKKFKDLPPCTLPKNLKLYEFDQIYTAPNCGFNNAMDYYNKCSAAHVVEDIAIPCKILLSEDDPIISAKSLDQYNFRKNIEVFKTKKGGHMGYLGSPRSEQGFYWLDSLLEGWVREFLKP